MADDRIRESLSALMDNESDELEARRLARALDEDADLLSQWRRWQLVGDAMRGDRSVDLVAGVRAALENEPALPAANDAALAPDPAPARQEPGGSLRLLGRVAIAASVAVALVFAVQLLDNEPGPSESPQVAVVPPPATLDDNALQPAAASHDAHLDRYMQRHGAIAAGSGRRSVVPYVNVIHVGDQDSE